MLLSPLIKTDKLLVLLPFHPIVVVFTGAEETKTLSELRWMQNF